MLCYEGQKCENRNEVGWGGSQKRFIRIRYDGGCAYKQKYANKLLRSAASRSIHTHTRARDTGTGHGHTSKTDENEGGQAGVCVWDTRSACEKGMKRESQARPRFFATCHPIEQVTHQQDANQQDERNQRRNHEQQSASYGLRLL